MTRTYRQAKRAEAQEETRDRIVQAAMGLHLEQGVATTSFAEVAARAGVGAATVYRHFPTVGALVDACGAHIWQEIEPPSPEAATAAFAGIERRDARIGRLVDELDAFYGRAAAPIWSAMRDADRVPELAGFVGDVRAGIRALVTAALGNDPPAHVVGIVAPVADFAVWRSLTEAGLDSNERRRLLVAMIDAAIGNVGQK